MAPRPLWRGAGPYGIAFKRRQPLVWENLGRRADESCPTRFRSAFNRSFGHIPPFQTQYRDTRRMAPSKAPPKLAKVSHPDAHSPGATLSAPSPRLEQYGVQVGHGRHPATQFWACRAAESLTIFCPPISQTRAQALQAAREAQLKTPPPMGQVRGGLGESFGRQKGQHSDAHPISI